jgi:hypothetical protein
VGGWVNFMASNRVIHKVKENTTPHSWVWSYMGWEFLKIPVKMYIKQGFKLTILVVNWVSSCLSFLLSASTAATDIFTAPTTTGTSTCTYSRALCIKCWVSSFHNKNFLTLQIPLERGEKRGWKEAPKRGWRQRVTFMDSSNALLP